MEACDTLWGYCSGDQWVAESIRLHRTPWCPLFSLRNGFTAYNELSPVSLVLLPPQTPTSGRQDHTSLPYAFTPFAKAFPRPSLPVPRSWRSRAPLWSGRDDDHMPRFVLLIKRNIFDSCRFFA